MTIHIGADPNWYSGEQIAQDRAWGEVLQALTERRRREDEDAKMAGQLISQFPDPSLIQEMSQKYGDNASFRMAVEAAKRRSGLNEKFFTGVSRGQQDYRDAVHDVGQAGQMETLATLSQGVRAIDPSLGMAFGGIGSMAHDAGQDMQRNVLNMDPSGVETGFQGLSPGEQAQFVPYAHDAYGLDMNRLVPERPGYGSFNKDVAGTLYATRALGGDPNELVTATQIGSGLIPSPGRMAEERQKQVIGNENSARDLREQKALEDYKQPLALARIHEQQKGADWVVDPANPDQMIPAPLKGGSGGVTPAQKITAAYNAIARAIPDPVPPADYGEDKMKDKVWDFAAAREMENSKQAAQSLALKAVSAGIDPELVGRAISINMTVKHMTFADAVKEVLADPKLR